MKYIDKVHSPADLKGMSVRALAAYADEARRFLVRSVAKTGGHLSSNLGVADLTVALHFCFHQPEDQIVWDVGHQAYVHKLITGRAAQFKTLRQFGGLSGFPKLSESEYDSFGTGHSSTSVSAAYGLAVARDLRGEQHNVVAVIGDGALTGGLAYEAMNNAGRSGRNLVVVLNDNQMSISENVGALSRHLNEIRTAPEYLGAKRGVNRLLDKVPVVGNKVGRFIERAKDGLKYMLVPGVLFEEMGFTYIGPVDGHNMAQLVSVFRKVARMKGPVLVHVYTKKGKGYENAEACPEAFHGVEAFDVKTGESLHKQSGESFGHVLGDTLADIARVDKRVVAVTAAMPVGTGLCAFQKLFPDRFFDVGIAEAHAVTFAAGLAKAGMVPVFAVYSTFLQRAYDQVLHDVCTQNLPVVFAIDRAGVVGADGETHQGLFDLSYLSHMPNMTVMAPKDGAELAMMLRFAVQLGAPVAIRYPKGQPELSAAEPAEIVLGRAEVLRQGAGVGIVFVGSMADVAARLVERLAAEGYDPMLINARFVKPMDADMVRRLAGCTHVFALEENVETGGFGMQLRTALAKENNHVRLSCFAFPDAFVPQGTREELLRLHGLDAESVCVRALAALAGGDA